MHVRQLEDMINNHHSSSGEGGRCFHQRRGWKWKVIKPARCCQRDLHSHLQWMQIRIQAGPISECCEVTANGWMKDEDANAPPGGGIALGVHFLQTSENPPQATDQSKSICERLHRDHDSAGPERMHRKDGDGVIDFLFSHCSVPEQHFVSPAK
ncbi:hypothetical protein llap_7326 [Limosa lapponica baueri]|uniref:Uncharacterized protein n=1 Tax=Limosa lapponica baueri TaxID=1758121 RepID=A0A2I0U8I0_LIMLA|nr:hypothetical protein llap_7326 [Limosa lapponica baueri]